MTRKTLIRLAACTAVAITGFVLLIVTKLPPYRICFLFFAAAFGFVAPYFDNVRHVETERDVHSLWQKISASVIYFMFLMGVCGFICNNASSWSGFGLGCLFWLGTGIVVGIIDYFGHLKQ